VRDVPDILQTIVTGKRAGLPGLEARRGALEAAASLAGPRRGFAGALDRAPAIIAEIKQASPSKGLLTTAFDPSKQASVYERGGAACLSVLTEEHHFRGSWDHFAAARAACRLPMLRKDFTVDGIHVIEAAAHGADAILLIAAILDERDLRDFREQAESLGMDALVEVHDEGELRAALASGARIIGVNNRNLRTFEVTLETSLRLAGKIPSGVVKVAESGITSNRDILELRAAGYQGFLIGEFLMRSPDPEAGLRALAGQYDH
jgi:indole-3-glycerol phosphate synthase